MNYSENKKKIKIQLINFEQIHVSSHKEYRGEELNKMFRGLGGRYDANMRGYILEFRRYEEVLNGIKAYLLNKRIPWMGVLEGIPKTTLDYVKPLPMNLTFKVMLKNNLGEDVNEQRIQIGYDEDDERERSIQNLPARFGQRLYGFQKEGIEFGIRRYGRLLFGDEMGVGKTIQALGLAAVYEADWPCLVVCPASLKYNWRSEISEWLSDLVFDGECKILQHGYEPLRDNVKFIILSYDLAKRIPERLTEINFNVVIVDEAHYLKNDKSKRSETLLPIFKACKRVIMLTGTPALARPKELYSILNCIRPDLFTDFIHFGRRYCMNHRNNKPGAEYDGSENMEELNFVLKNVMIRRLKKDVLTELPSKIRQKVMIRTSGPKVGEILRLRDRVEHESGQKISSIIDSLADMAQSTDPQARAEFASSGLDSILQKGSENNGKRAYSNAMTCFEMSSHCKLEGVLEFLEEMEEYEKKIVVFAYHKLMIEGLENWASKKQQDFIRIDGRVDSMKRGHLVEKFQTDPKCKYAFLSIVAASTGLTLTAASTVVFAELHWTPALIIQAEDRCHRISQKETVNCYYLIGENTMDDIIYAMIKAKFDITSKILDGDNAQKLVVDESKAGSLIMKLSKEDLDRELADIQQNQDHEYNDGSPHQGHPDGDGFGHHDEKPASEGGSLFSDKVGSLFSSSYRSNFTSEKSTLSERELGQTWDPAGYQKEPGLDTFWKDKASQNVVSTSSVSYYQPKQQPCPANDPYWLKQHPAPIPDTDWEQSPMTGNRPDFWSAPPPPLTLGFHSGNQGPTYSRNPTYPPRVTQQPAQSFYQPSSVPARHPPRPLQFNRPLPPTQITPSQAHHPPHTDGAYPGSHQYQPEPITRPHHPQHQQPQPSVHYYQQASQPPPDRPTHAPVETTTGAPWPAAAQRLPATPPTHTPGNTSVFDLQAFAFAGDRIL